MQGRRITILGLELKVGIKFRVCHVFNYLNVFQFNICLCDGSQVCILAKHFIQLLGGAPPVSVRDWPPDRRPLSNKWESDL